MQEFQCDYLPRCVRSALRRKVRPMAGDPAGPVRHAPENRPLLLRKIASRTGRGANEQRRGIAAMFRFSAPIPPFRNMTAFSGPIRIS